jgi:hypothetical protein
MQQLVSIAQLDLQVFELAGSGDSLALEEAIALWAEYFPEYAQLPANVEELRLAAQGQAIVACMRPHFWLVRVAGQPVGMSFFLYNPQRWVGMLLFFALHPSVRRLAPPGFERLSDFLIAQMIAQVQKEAGEEHALGLALEVDSPALAARYQHMGLHLFDLTYGEPMGGQTAEMLAGNVLDETQFHRLFLGLFPLSAARARPVPEAAHQVVLAFLLDYYGLPSDHPVLIQALQTISQGETWTT